MQKEKRKRIIFIITTSLFWFSLYTYVPTFPGYIEDSGVSHGMVGIIIGSYGFSQMLIRIPLGIVSDRLNRRKLFIILGILSSLFSGLGLWIFNSALSMLLFRSLAGVAAASWVTFSVLFSSYFKSTESSKAIGYILAANNLGQVLAMMSGSSVVGKFGAKSPFLLGAAVAVIGLITGMFIVENKDIKKEPMSMGQLVSVGKSKGLITLSVLAIFTQFISYATVYGFTPIIAETMGANSSQLGLLTTLSVLPGIPAGALSGSFFAKRFGEKKTLISGFIIVALACMVIPLTSHFSVLIITQTIGGFGRGVIIPLLMGLSIKTIEESKRGTYTLYKPLEFLIPYLIQ
jgi:MFS family permease